MVAPRLYQLCHSPRIYVADAFASPAECGHVRSLGLDPDFAASRGIQATRDETGYAFEMPVDGDAVLDELRTRIHDTLGLVNAHGGTMRFRRYGVGEAHPPHLDCYEIRGAHLVCTALVGLTDCDEGGETRFPRAFPSPVSVRPRQGRLVAWFNYYPNGAPDQASFHEGAPVVRGEKATITAFLYGPLAAARERPAAATGWKDSW